MFGVFFTLLHSSKQNRWLIFCLLVNVIGWLLKLWLPRVAASAAPLMYKLSGGNTDAQTLFRTRVWGIKVSLEPAIVVPFLVPPGAFEIFISILSGTEVPCSWRHAGSSHSLSCWCPFSVLGSLRRNAEAPSADSAVWPRVPARASASVGPSAPSLIAVTTCRHG